MNHQTLRGAKKVIPDKVPGREHYSTQYIEGGRIFSFAHQINAVISLKPRSILEVGVGTGIAAKVLKSTGLSVTTLDIQPDLCPDLLGSVTAIPAEDAEFDVALCSQVLEHLPFEQFTSALVELHRVLRNALVLSLPDVTLYAAVRCVLPWLGKVQLDWNPRRLRAKSFPPQRYQEMGHYWEIGYRGYELPRVISAIQSTGWAVSRTWRVSELPWHRFFILEKIQITTTRD